MKTNLTQKIAFITGANRGLGFQTARELGRQGVLVVLGSRDLAKGEAAAAQLRAEGITAEVLKFEAVNPADHRAAYQYFQDRHGRLDILVNNAGVLIYDEANGPRDDAPNQTSLTPAKDLRETFEINFFAPIALTQTLLPLIRKSPAGRIVNLSSILGSLTLHSDPASPIYGKKNLPYDASKTALNAFTVHLAHELLGTNIKVNSAHPGWVRTDMGGPNATLDISEGGKTSAQLALLDDNGPTGGFFHLGQPLPW